MNLRRVTVAVTTDGSGDATTYTSDALTGCVLMISYIKTNFADGVDFTITTETTLQQLWVDTNINAAEIVYPRCATNGSTGAALLYAGGGTAVTDRIYLVNERIKFVVASGGAATAGSFVVIVG